jgi:hypothetical protein
MNHSFNIEDAKKYGVNCAVILENIRFWVAKNKANAKHSYDGKYWTYNSIKAFHELFPYLSERQIRTALDKLIEAKEIEKGNYNQNSYDQTTWYSCVNSICQESQIDLTLKSNGIDSEVKCIIGTDINTDINHIRKDIKHIPKDLESNSTTKILGSLDWQKGIALDGEHNSWRFLHRQVKGTHSNVTLPDLQKKCTLFTEQESQGEPKTPFEWSKHFINFCKYQKFTQAKESSLPSATKSDWKK